MLRNLGFGLLSAFSLMGPVRAEPVSSFMLDNGMQVVVIEDHRAPVVVQMVWYRTGSADEPAGHSGIAHFLEHLMFKATDTMASGEFSDTVAAEGGRDNAFTSFDFTAYHQRVAADRLDLMMRMEADRMRGLQLTEEEVATERQVILEERNQRTDSSPGALLNEQMGAAQYLNHPYGIPVIGWRHEMEQLSREDAFAFYHANYAPNNAILIVAGDVQPDAVLQLAKTHYGPLEPSDAIKPRLRPQEPPQLAARRLVMTDQRVSEPYVLRSYLSVERNPGDQRQAAAMVLLSEVLGGSSTTSVLARALQFDSKIAVYTSASYNPTTVDPDTFSLVVLPQAEVSLAEVEAALDAELAKFLETGIAPEDFARIKAQIRAEDVYDRDNTQGLAQQYGAALAVGLTLEDIAEWPKLLQDVTADEVMAAAREVFDDKTSVTAWLQSAEGKTE
jgi:zinc protease